MYHKKTKDWAKWRNLHSCDDGRGKRTVLLNGQPIRYAIKANIRRGFVVAGMVDDDGLPIFDDAKNEWRTVKLRGKVKVIFDKGGCDVS